VLLQTKKGGNKMVPIDRHPAHLLIERGSSGIFSFLFIWPELQLDYNYSNNQCKASEKPGGLYNEEVKQR